MKSNIWIMALLLTAVPAVAFAHGDKIDMTSDGIGAGLKKFQLDHASRVADFTGVKGWVDADKIMVKVYLKDNSAITYSCTMMEMGAGVEDMITCTQQ